MELKIRGRRVVNIGNSKGFIIPTEYLAHNLSGGLNENARYDLIVIESIEDETTD